MWEMGTVLFFQKNKRKMYTKNMICYIMYKNKYGRGNDGRFS